MKQILAVFLALFVCNASAFWRQCHTNAPMPNSVSSPACSATACDITRGSSLSGTVVWTPTAAHSAINLHVRFQTGADSWSEIPVSDPNACPGMSPGCPTSPGTSTTFSLNIPIPTDLPQTINTNFELFLVAGSEVLCWQQTVTVH